MCQLELVVIGKAHEVMVGEADGQIQRHSFAKVGHGMLIPFFDVPKHAVSQRDPLGKSGLASTVAEVVCSKPNFNRGLSKRL